MWGCFVFFFSSRLCCPLRFQNSPQTHRWEGFLVFRNFSFTTPSPGWVSVPNSFVSLFLFYILPYNFLKTMGFLSGCLVSSSSIQKLFRGIFSAFKWSFDEFVGEKEVSPSYSSAVLGPPPQPTLKKEGSQHVCFGPCWTSSISQKLHAWCMVNAQQRFDAFRLDIAIDSLFLAENSLTCSKHLRETC